MDYIIKIKRSKQLPLRQRWLWKMAWNDAKFNLGRLALFISSIVIGVAGLVAINGFNDNLKQDIDSQAKELVGADLVVENDDNEVAFSDSALVFIDSLSEAQARGARFASMAYFSNNGGSRLVQVIALQGPYPFYGSIETTENSDLAAFSNGSGVMIDEALATQFSAQLGDSLKLGQGTYPIVAVVLQFPGSANFTTTIAPSVYLPYGKLDETGLIQFGSRVEYNYYYKLDEQYLESVEEKLQTLRDQSGISWDTVEEEKEDLSRGFQNLYEYFNLLSFVALIMGSIGVASSIFIYIKEKRNTAAILRCVGAGEWQIFHVFFAQVMVLGLVGSLLGVFAGLITQYFLPLIMQDFLPIDVTVSISWSAVLIGMAAGMIISLLFSALPLNGIRFVSPLEILRGIGIGKRPFSKFRLIILISIIVFPWIFTWLQIRDIAKTSAFYLGLAITFALLYILSKILIAVVKKLMQLKAPFVWRQGFSNLFRPNNQTAVLVIVIGLGAFLIATMALIQNSLLGQVEFAGSGERTNTVLFDIQPYQKADVMELVQQYELPVQQLVPIVTMRIDSLKGKAIETWQADTAADLSNWRLTREYRVTYRDSLINSEKLLKGEYQHTAPQAGDSIFVSLSQEMTNSLNLKLEDEIVWDVQGIPITTYLGSTREVDWQRIQTNFMVVFPPGVLQDAPQFYVLLTRIEEKQKAATFQQQLVQTFPNVSLIDLNLILDTLDKVFNKIAFVIRFMALFTIITGMLVLSAAVINSKYARLKENVLLRTIGAVKKQIIGITLVEYSLLGLFAGLSGVLLAYLGAWLLAVYLFEIRFFPDIVSLLFIWLLVTGLTVFIGWVNTRQVLHRSPLEVLRKES